MILFFDTNYKDDYYSVQRNKIEGVKSVKLFKYNNKFSIIIRRLKQFIGLSLISDLGINIYKIRNVSTIILPVTKYSPTLHKQIKKIDKNLRIIHWYWNPISNVKTKPNMIPSSNNDIFTFDKNDSEKYKIKFKETYYFSSIDFENKSISNDITFIGYDKGRLEILEELKEKFSKFNISTYLHVVRDNSSNKTFNYKPMIKYSEILNIISGTKCILDIVQVGQEGKTQRPLESLFLRKKLITNDKNIINYDFYNSNNIFIIGMDKESRLLNFINSEYYEIDKKIISKYSFENWIEEFKEPQSKDNRNA